MAQRTKLFVTARRLQEQWFQIWKLFSFSFPVKFLYGEITRTVFKTKNYPDLIPSKAVKWGD
jgi:hypothetical protein